MQNPRTSTRLLGFWTHILETFSNRFQIICKRSTKICDGQKSLPLTLQNKANHTSPSLFRLAGGLGPPWTWPPCHNPLDHELPDPPDRAPRSWATWPMPLEPWTTWPPWSAPPSGPWTTWAPDPHPQTADHLAWPQAMDYLAQPPDPTPPDTCENIIFPRTTYVVGKSGVGCGVNAVDFWNHHTRTYNIILRILCVNWNGLPSELNIKHLVICEACNIPISLFKTRLHNLIKYCDRWI